MNRHRSEARVNVEMVRPEHPSRFAELDREWLAKYNLMEPTERPSHSPGVQLPAPVCSSIVRIVGIRYCTVPEVRTYANSDVCRELNFDIAARVRAADGAAAET
jgi:hypothetical protein